MDTAGLQRGDSFVESAALYDAIYHFKDYARECERLRALIGEAVPDARIRVGRNGSALRRRRLDGPRPLPGQAPRPLRRRPRCPTSHPARCCAGVRASPAGRKAIPRIRDSSTPGKRPTAELHEPARSSR